MPKIENVYAREVLDSRWNPTVEVEITLQNWIIWSGIVPSWASTWVHEALELRDQDKSRFLWKWVLKAVENVNTTIKNKIVWNSYESYKELDKEMIELDWTENKSNLWANAILWVSMAFVVACAKMENKWVYEYINPNGEKGLPTPMMNIINWWSHGDNNLDIQEFMIMPVNAKSIKQALRMWAEVFHNLKKILQSNNYNTWVWDEGWYAPSLNNNEEAIELIIKAIEKAWYTTDDIKIALDVASSEFFKDWKYHLEWEWKVLNSSELVDFYENLVNKYPIISIEDWMDEDDFEWWKILNKKLWDKIMTVWDDLFVTNINRLSKWIKENIANAILIKLNQIGTVSKTIEAINMAKKANMNSIISHRSWETEDTFIADLVVALNTWYIKTGSLSRTDRIAKYNQLIRIEEKL